MEGKKPEGSGWMKNAVLWTLQDLAWSAVVLFLWKHLFWPWDIPFAVCVPSLLVHLVPRWVRLLDFLLGSDERISGKVLRRVSRPVRLLAPVLGMLLFCGFLEPPGAHVLMADSLGSDFLWVLELALTSLATLFLLLGNGIGGLALGPIPPSPPVPVEVPKKFTDMTKEERFRDLTRRPPTSDSEFLFGCVALLIICGVMLLLASNDVKEDLITRAGPDSTVVITNKWWYEQVRPRGSPDRYHYLSWNAQWYPNSVLNGPMPEISPMEKIEVAKWLWDEKVCGDTLKVVFPAGNRLPRLRYTAEHSLFNGVWIGFFLFGVQGFSVVIVYVLRDKWRQQSGPKPDEEAPPVPKPSADENAPPASGSGKKRRRKR